MNTPPNIQKSTLPIEYIWLAGATLFGTTLRLSFPERMAVEHFDEGVYASNFWCGGGTYPAQYLYAPPLLPFAIEWTMIISALWGIKPTGFIPMIPCLIAGIATIPSIWWICRRWFGPAAGLTSAWLVATSDFHACYSRAALTDVPVCLFMLWAVYFIRQAYVCIPPVNEPITKRGIAKALRREKFPWREIFLAGFFTGLAWWTKYNGWLPLAIGLAGGTLGQLMTPKPERRIRHTCICWSLIALISSVIWSPVLWSLQRDGIGGYASVAANHRLYLVGINGWRNSAIKQSQTIGMYDNLLGMLMEPVIASKLTDIAPPDPSLSEISGEVFRLIQQLFSLQLNVDLLRRTATSIVVIANSWISQLTPLVLLLIVASSLFKLSRFPANYPNRISGSLLSAWIIGLTISTPFYHPYPRLVFPWLTAIWIGVGLAVQQWGTWALRSQEFEFNSKSWKPHPLILTFFVWMIANSLIRSTFGNAHAWNDRTTIATVSQKFTETIREKQLQKNGTSAIGIWGEPAMFFGLRANGFQGVSPVPNLDFITRPMTASTFAIFGKQNSDGPNFSTAREQLERCELCGVERYHASHLVEMDSQISANFYRTNTRDASDGDGAIWLYHVRD